MLRALAAVVAVLLLALGGARAQPVFRITYDVDRSDSTRVHINGRVFNDALQDALDVHVTVEALDGGGRVVSRGISFVALQIPGRGSAPFAVAVPAVAGIARFRVSVSSFRVGFGPQS